MCVCVPCACLVSSEARQGAGPPGAGVMDGCKPQCGCWELNPDLLSSARATGALNCGAISPAPQPWAGTVGLLVECLPSVQEALGSIPGTT